jgi:hypothetical protein
MKPLILAAFTLTLAASGFAQGTVTFNNRVVGSIVTHVYAPMAGNAAVSMIGNGTADTPPGTVDWSGFTPIGANGTGGQFGGATTIAQLLAAPGVNQPYSSLVPQATGLATFRTGVAAGFINGGITVTLSNVLPDAPGATFEMVAWDNSSGLYPTWTQASVGVRAGLIAFGTTGTFNVGPIGGTTTPPNLTGLRSFNLYLIPEPSMLALLSLGAALLIFRLRK